MGSGRRSGRATGDIHVRSDGPKYTIPLDSVAGATAATIELIATTSSNLPLDVAVDDIRESRAAVPLAVLNVDANDAYTVFLNGDEVGTGASNLQPNHDLRLQPGANVIAFEVDGTGVGPSMVASMTFGSLCSDRRDGWKSSTIQMDGSIEEDWMTLGFDSVPWANVPTDGPESNSVSPSYLGLRRGESPFCEQSDGGTRQYFRRLFTSKIPKTKSQMPSTCARWIRRVLNGIAMVMGSGTPVTSVSIVPILPSVSRWLKAACRARRRK